jgi:FAD/FMN-containing dehydrogenase
MLPPPKIRGIFRSDPRARAAYAEGAGIYRIVPQAVCVPADTQDLERLVCWAGDRHLALVPRGAGSAMGGGNVGEGVIVDLTGLPRRLEVDPSSGRAVTSANVTHAELSTVAARHGLRLPPDPSSGRWATLGGMVATNAAGARSVRYGSVRPWVEGLSVLTADGITSELRRKQQMSPVKSPALSRFMRLAAPDIAGATSLIASRFPKTRKNSSGYALDAYLASGDVLDLFIGSEGTLGIVTQIEWRLDPAPPSRAGLRLALKSLDDLQSAVAAMSPLQPSALELLDRSFLDLVGEDALQGAALRFPGMEAVLLVELERDDPASLRRAVEDASARARSLAHAVEVAFSPAAATRLWAIRHAASPILAQLPESRRSLQVIEDACVPLDQMGEYIRAVRRAGTKYNLPVVLFGHAGDGHIHVNLLPDVTRPGWEENVSALMDEVGATVLDLGGTPSGEHGDGRLRSKAVERLYGPEILELFRLLKRTLDPSAILNPGVILSAGTPPITQLKVGRNAIPLPDDLDQALREIERSGGYAKSRLELAGEELNEGLGPRV